MVQGNQPACLATSHGLPADRFPVNDEEQQKAEKVLLTELHKLSLEEHEKILFDLYGISGSNDLLLEDNESVTDDSRKISVKEELLKELIKELETIPAEKKRAYLMAASMNPTYVQSEDFVKIFLRAKNYNPKDAAVLIVDHFELKKELFGSGPVLSREIHLADLSSSDRKTVDSGFIQVSFRRDVAGRTIRFVLPAALTYETEENVHRAIWYISMAMLRDEETQKKGIVQVAYNFRKSPQSFSFIQRILRLKKAVPGCVVAYHYCYNNHDLLPALTGFQMLLFHDSNRFRFKKHFGDLSKVNFELQTFGISTDDSPMQDQDEWSTKWHLEWLKSQEDYENRLPALSAPVEIMRMPKVFVIPRNFDVLFGKDKTAMSHPGNLRCQVVVEMHWDAYNNASRKHKTLVADNVIKIINNSSGRFLKRQRGGWVEVDHAVAREKVSHFFRRLREKQHHQEKNIADGT